MFEMTTAHWWAFGASLVVFVLVLLWAILKVIQSNKIKSLANQLQQHKSNPAAVEKLARKLLDLA